MYMYFSKVRHEIDGRVRHDLDKRLHVHVLKVTITSLLINIHEMFSVLIFSTQQDATETW